MRVETSSTLRFQIVILCRLESPRIHTVNFPWSAQLINSSLRLGDFAVTGMHADQLPLI
jgi:phage terminase large subunit GpA-like protein